MTYDLRSNSFKYRRKVRICTQSYILRVDMYFYRISRVVNNPLIYIRRPKLEVNFFRLSAHTYLK
jgi:hypothetical protein